MTAVHSVQHVRDGDNFVAVCVCGWKSEPSISTDGLGTRCALEFDAEIRRDYAVVRTLGGAERIYQLRPNGTAELISTRGLAGTPATVVVDEGVRKLALEDGRSVVVVQQTCDACQKPFDIGVGGARGRVFCSAECRNDYWRTH